MPKNQKAKVKGNAEVKSNGKASSDRRYEAQLERQEANSKLQIGESTPWEKAKAKRLANRIRNGKTYSNWFKSQTSSKPRPNSSNTVTGLESKSVRGVKERDPYDARESYGLS